MPTNQDSPSMRDPGSAWLFGRAAALVSVVFSDPVNTEPCRSKRGGDVSFLVESRGICVSGNRGVSLGPWAQRRLRLRQYSHARRVRLRLEGSPSESFATKVKIFSRPGISEIHRLIAVCIPKRSSARAPLLAEFPIQEIGPHWSLCMGKIGHCPSIVANSKLASDTDVPTLEGNVDIPSIMSDC